MRRLRKRKTVVEAPQIPRVRIQYFDLNDLEPYEFNPRDNAAAIKSVANSIKEFGFLVPVVIDSDMVLVAGHTRVEAAKILGMSEVPGIMAGHLSDEQIRQFRLIDNKVAELSKWNTDLLGDEIRALAESGIDFTDFGWTHEEIDCLSEIVQDDCLSAGTVAAMDQVEQNRVAEQRAPNRTRFVCGEFIFFIPTQVYRNWANQVRVTCDYDEQEITRWLQGHLDLEAYMTQQ